MYLVDFKENVGAEFSGKHYAIVITPQKDNTLVVVPITSKKSGKRYRYGLTLDNSKYLKSPKYPKAFALVRKIREIDRKRIIGSMRYKLDSEDSEKLISKIEEILLDK
ncbi:type II toxin-antitoxin system PemK/MazF family toxin [Aerococcaceae bacterium zg-ZUI334]|nr:type II toxin-antitoxin system PemK/MazF family toxin [Aerococcaceae bacterium zg-ZUI334]MBS4462550.1 type II toxin-antitoxin system PemK/MazF family toxin [Aerococcaceae bacterium zg-B36]